MSVIEALFYDNFSIKYASKLTGLIENTSGGLKELMIIGANSLIPDRILFSNINKQEGKVSCSLKKWQIILGIPGTINELNLYKLSLHKKKLGKKLQL